MFSLFVPFFHEIAKPSSGSTLGGLAVSPKVLPYFGGLHLMASANGNVVAAAAGLVRN